MHKPGKAVMLTRLEMFILSAFIEHLYMTEKEIAYTLRVLADKLDGRKTR